jgi:excisionase family DNA binding protein
LKSEENNIDGSVRLVTVKEAAQLLSVSVRTVWRMIADGELTPRRFRRCTRLLLAQVLNYLKGNGKVGGL